MTTSPEQGLRQLLIGNIRIQRQVKDRVYPFKAPQGAPFPFLLYSRTTSAPEHRMSGASGLRGLSFQVDGYARSYEAMQALREAVRLSLDGFRGPVAVGGESIYFRHLFIESDADAFVEPQAAGDESIFSFSLDLSAMCPESIPTFR